MESVDNRAIATRSVLPMSTEDNRRLGDGDETLPQVTSYLHDGRQIEHGGLGGRGIYGGCGLFLPALAMKTEMNRNAPGPNVI